MHVYLREEPVRLRMVEVDAQGLVPGDSDLVPMAFYANDNDQPSLRALLPPDTVDALRNALDEPVTLGVLAEEPEDAGAEVRAMVGLAVPVTGEQARESESSEEKEPWRASVGDQDAWRGDSADDAVDDGSPPRTALLAFAPLVRLKRRFPADFGEELADLLETALSGATRPVLEARVDRMLEDL